MTNDRARTKMFECLCEPGQPPSVANGRSKIVLVLLLVLVLERWRIFEDEDEDDHEPDAGFTFGDADGHFPIAAPRAL